MRPTSGRRKKIAADAISSLTDFFVSARLDIEIKDRFVYFRIKEVRNGRIIFQFESSTRVPFDERDVVLTYEELNPGGR